MKRKWICNTDLRIKIELVQVYYGRWHAHIITEDQVHSHSTSKALRESNRVTLWATSYSACAVYTKTSQHYLNVKIERVQRRATRWILRTRIGKRSKRERLKRLNLLPLVLDRELKDLVFFL